ncbi:MAG: alpha-amylase family glycosyl hydrolase [Streptosporangiaceae bacterium]
MPAGSPWWHGGVLYQLYVRSWRDSGADGYGDLPGIIERLDHLAWLGVDGIWLSPAMPSPDDDWGYDVSDYTGVHPDLGTMADMDALIAAAGERGIRVLLDLVPNHTSSAHPWFAAALSGRDAEHRDYYVWADPAPGGGPPNNWRDATGQPAWQLDPASGQYYLHNFLVSQPDLNWWEPAVHREFEQILRFWFDRGVAGFRIDVAHGLYKDAQLRDNPPLAGGNPLQGQFGLRPVYNANQPQTHEVYRQWRGIAETYSPPRLLLGETWVSDADLLAAFYGQNDELQLAFNFPFAFGDFSAGRLSDVVARTLAALPPGACPVWMGSNHDVGRFPTRWCGGDERQARVALALLATLPGTMVLYYGDELGMTDMDVPVELQRDAMTIGGQGSDPNRDRARTPLRWDDSPGYGFTAAGIKPWLPFGADEAQVPSVAAQRADESSTLSFCRSLIALRRTELGGQPARYQPLPVPPGQWAYQVGGLTVTANLAGEPAVLDGPPPEVLLATPGTTSSDLGNLVLPPWSAVIARRH